MSYTLKLLIPVALGLIAAGINWMTIYSKTRPIEFICVTDDLDVGDVFESGSIEALPIPSDFSALDKTAIPYSDRGVLLRQRVNRKFTKGDIVFWRDVQAGGAQFDIQEDEDVLLVSIQGSLRPDPSLLRVGSYVSFRFGKKVDEKTGKPDVETAGPFRVVSVGGIVTNAIEDPSMRGDVNIIGVAVKDSPTAEAEKRQQLERLCDLKQLEQTELLQVFLHPGFAPRPNSSVDAMRVLFNKIGQSTQNVLEVSGDQIRIGRAPDNDIVLNSHFVAERAAVLARSGTHWEIIPLGENDILIGSRPLHPGERTLIRGDQPIEIYPFSLTLDTPTDEKVSDEQQRRSLDMRMSEFILEVHRLLLARLQVTADGEQRDNEELLMTLERDLEEIARLQGLFSPANSALLDHFAAHTLQAYVLGKILENVGASQDIWKTKGNWLRMYTAVPDLENELDTLSERFSNQLGLPQIADLSNRVDALEDGFWQAWAGVSAGLHPDAKKYFAVRYLKKQIKDIVFGYGPLEDLLRMPNLSEIMVVDSDRIYVEKNGVLEKSGRRFVSDEVTLSIIERIVSRVGRRIDKSQPLVDARLADGSRVNAVIPPLAVSGPCLTVRKFPSKRLRVQDLVQKGSLTATVSEFLKAAVLARCNILVAGGTGSGKTTLLNCLSDLIPDKERIVTIEDTAELQFQKEHVVRMETKLANVEGAGEYTIRDLVRNALRMRPDRVIVGECRGPEALDMLQAMNTGHDGSMTTIHANSAEDVILRLEVLVQMAADLPIHSIHRQIASAIDLIVQLTRMRDGARRVSQVTEVVDYDDQEQTIRTKDLFVLDHAAKNPQLVATGSLPSFMVELIEANLISLDAFYV